MLNEKNITIAIDGYSSCGKSTLAKAMAKVLNYTFIDTGAMYRCITLFALRHNFIGDNFIDINQIITSLNQLSIRFENEGGTQKVFLNNEDVSKEIRSLTIANFVSDVAAIKEVRSFLVKQQREMGENGGVIMDGRDIGSVVFPNAELKLFLTADTQIRAQRRFDELNNSGIEINIDDVEKNLLKRDHIDSTREESPLIQTADAIVIDNSELSQEEQLNLALWYAKARKTQELYQD